MRNFKLATLAATGLVALATSFNTAVAADLAARPVYKGPIVPAAFSWTGFYIGGNVGAGWGNKEFEQVIPLGTLAPVLPTIFSDGSHGVNGFLGGGQVGFNYQVGPTVWGIEFEGEGADIKGKGNCGIAALFNCSTKIDGILTLTGRFGLTWDRTLIYVKAGGAWVHDQSDVNLLGLNLNLGGGAVVVTPASLSSWRSGWVFGTGVEQAVFGNWSAKIEYNYMDFNDRTENFPVIRSNAAPIINGLFDRFDLTSRVHTIKFGVNYRFGWGSY